MTEELLRINFILGLDSGLALAISLFLYVKEHKRGER